MTNIWDTEYLFAGNTFKEVYKAVTLAQQGKKVILAVEETYLAKDICGTCQYHRNEVPEGFFPSECFKEELLIPDKCKGYLEDICLRAGVEFYYGLYYFDRIRERETGRLLIRFASKGGIYQILCDKVERHQVPSIESGVCLRAWVTEGDTGRNRLITAFSKASKESYAELLLEIREKVLGQFEKERQNTPVLKLGRFADRIIEQKNTDAERKAAPKNRKDNSGERVDVIVAGGGTAGAMAALYAAREGAKTLLIEPQYDLGGTSTVGGVNAYWFGTRFKDVTEVDEAIDAVCEQYHIRRSSGIFGRFDEFHGGIRGMVLLKLCLTAGVKVLFGQIVYDVVKENGRVTGVLTTGREGKRAYYAKAVIDATGDGDLAQAAGAEMTYGSEKEAFTYWASLAQYTGVESYRNNFSSMVRTDDVKDMTRFIYAGRRRGENTFDHGSYVSTRESRHLKGKQVIDLRDICMHRTYEDGIYTCFSNYDPKGKLDADMVYCGYLPPQVRIQIPLGALLPIDHKGNRIQGMYVAGKAISATHNAFPSLRMQPDLMHQGAVLGLLTAKAVKAGTEAENLNYEECKKWIQESTGDDLSIETENAPYSLAEAVKEIEESSRTHWIDVPFTYEEKKHSPVLAVVCAESEEVLPFLKQRIKELEEGEDAFGFSGKIKRKNSLRMLKRLALFHGSNDAAKEIEADILKTLQEAAPHLPLRKGPATCAQLLPDHGVMPEVVYDMNLLSFSRDFSMRPYEIVTERLSKTERDYQRIEKGIFTYIESIVYSAENSGKREFVPLLQELAAFPEFQDAFSPEKKIELMSERLQMLWVMIHRALWKLGCREGERGLWKSEKSDSLTIRLSAGKALEEKRQGPGNKSSNTGKIEKYW